MADYYTAKIIEHGPVPRGVDWNSGVLQRGRADDVSFLDAGACIVHVSAGAARRDGIRQRVLGRVGGAQRRSGGSGLVGAGNGGRVEQHLVASFDWS